MKITLIAFFYLLFTIAARAQSNIVFIVNSNNPTTSITSYELENLFMKKSRNWTNGTPVHFFDREESSKERREFLNIYIKRSSRDIDQYWIGQKLYTGNAAPTQVTSDRMMISLVARFPGAIGYVSATNLGEIKNVKKIEIIGK